MNETQVLMNLTFLDFLSRNHFLEGNFIFQWEGIFLSRGRGGGTWGIRFDGGRGGFKRNHEMGDTSCTTHTHIHTHTHTHTHPIMANPNL